MSISIEAEARRRTFHTLDALRGVAAIEVVTRHAGHLFGDLHLPESYLAVDLFFVMSGVVIANAYETRLQSGMPWTDFMRIRIIRLYPLYIVGILLGLVFFVGSRLGDHIFSASETFGALGLALLMLPPGPFPPLVGPRWSLFFEMIANLIYGFAIKLLSNAVLAGIALISAAGLAYAAWTRHGLDLGWENGTYLFGACRVGYSFSVGLLIWRVWRKAPRRAPLLAWAYVAGVAIALGLPIAVGARPWYELAMVLVGFPLIVGGAMITDVDGLTRKAFTFLGTVSYAVYILHEPCARLFEAVVKRSGHLLGAIPMPVLGTAFLCGLVVGCWVIDAVYDMPVRRWALRVSKPAPLTEAQKVVHS